jgi:HK97 gp10 family phage protein
MAKATISVKVDVAGLDRYGSVAQVALADAVQAEAEAIAADAADRAPVRTGALKASIRADQEDGFNWTVHDGVSYGQYQEFGWVHGSPQPFLTPAVETARTRFPERIAATLEDAARATR